MENKMLEMFICYVMAFAEEGTEDYSLKGCIERIDTAIKKIKDESLEKWYEYLIEPFEDISHPVLDLKEELSALTEKDYLEKLERCKDLIQKYYKYGIDVDECLYLLESKQDVETLVDMILLNDEDINGLKDKVDKIKKATKENSLIINEMSNRYAMGRDIEQNHEEAVKGYERIAEQNKYAKRSLAIYLWSGKGIEKDCTKAFKLFSELKESGDIVSEFYVAEMMYNGEGTEKNVDAAKELFKNIRGRTSYYFENKILEYIYK